MVPIVCLWLECGKLILSSTQCLVTHICTYLIYREITGLQSFLAQFNCFKAIQHLSYMCMVQLHCGGRGREGEEKRKGEGGRVSSVSGARRKSLVGTECAPMPGIQTTPLLIFMNSCKVGISIPVLRINEETEAYTHCLLSAKQIRSGCARI